VVLKHPIGLYSLDGAVTRFFDTTVSKVYGITSGKG
jgi:hypothetical protein